MKGRCLLLLIGSVLLIGCSVAVGANSHKLVKRQFPSRPGGGSFSLSRRRQFPPPEELEESEYVDSGEEALPQNVAPAFRGRQPPLSEDDYPDDHTYTEAPKVTTPSPPKPTSRTLAFNNRFAARPRFGSQTTAKTTSEPKSSAPPPASARVATPAQSQRLDVVASILNRPAPPRQSSRAIASKPAAENAEKKPEAEVSTRRSSNQRVRARGRLRTRTSSTTTTTTTTTQAPLSEEYYYYYEDEEETPKNQAIATTTSTTTTTTTTVKPRFSNNRPRPVNIRNRPATSKTTKAPVKFDLELQFAPPPEDPVEVKAETHSTKRFTTSSTMSPEESGGIPPHLRHKYRPRTDGRFIDFLRDPNRPRELKGFDLTDYPFYIVVPDDITFECDDKKDGYYASIPHKCQLFHYCFAGARYDFLCANYTLYDQTTFTCRFANNVDCESSAKYYYRNDDLWKETTTTPAPTSPPRKRRPKPRDEDYEDYEDEEYYDDYEEESRRRRPPKRRRNRRKNRRRPTPSEEEVDETKKK